MQPSKEGPPHQSITCCSRPLPFIWEISVVYVLQQQSRHSQKGQRQQECSMQGLSSSYSLQLDISGNNDFMHSKLWSSDIDLYVSSALKPNFYAGVQHASASPEKQATCSGMANVWSDACACTYGCKQQRLHEENSFLHVPGQAGRPCLLVKRLTVVDDVEVAVQTAQVTLSIMVQIRAGAHPDVAPSASCKVVQNDAGNLTALAHPCSITNEKSSPCCITECCHS